MFLRLEKQKSSYHKILLSLLILGVLLVFSLSIIFTISSENHNVSIIAEADRRALELIAYSNEYIDNSAKIFAMTLMTDNQIKKLIYGQDIELWEAVNIMNNLRFQVKGNSLIHSVYIYNKKSMMIYSTYRKLSQNKNDFFDQSISSIISNNEFPRKLSAVARKIPDSSFEGSNLFTDVFTYIIPVHPYDRSSFPTSIIVNVDAGSLMEIINHQLSGDSGEIIVINDEEQIVGHTNPSRFLTPLGSPYSAIINRMKEGEYRRFRENGSDQLVTSFQTENSSFRYIKISDYRIIMHPAIKQRILLLVIGGLYLSVIWILSVLFSKNLYKPIEKLVAQIEKIGEVSSNRELDQGELEYVATAFSDAVEKISSLSSFRKDNVDVLKKQFIVDLAQGRIKDIQTIKSQLHMLESRLIDFSWFRLLLIHLDSEEKNKMIPLSEIAINNSFQNRLSMLDRGESFSPCEILVIDANNVLVIIGSDTPVNRKEMSSLNSILTKEIKPCSNCITTAALSTGAEGLGSLSEQYREIVELIEYRIVTGPKSLITISDIENRIDESIPFPLKEERKLLNFIKSGDLEFCHHTYNKISIIISHYSYENIRLGYMRLAASVFDYLNSLEADAAEAVDFRFTDFSRQLNEKLFITDIDQLFSSLFLSISRYISKNSTGKSKKNVDAVIEIIEQEYRDTGLSLTMVANRMKMSPVYLGRIFKQLRTQSFNNFLTNYRLEKSKELIRSTNDTIESISNEVGISNTRFFFTKFKSEYGMTPSQFRKKFLLER